MPGAYSYYYVDWTYIALLLPVMLLALYAQTRVKSTFRSASQMRTQRGLTGYDAARMVLDNHGLYHVRIEHISGTLTDNYNPRKQTIFLSDDVYGVATPAAVGVAAHEAGAPKFYHQSHQYWLLACYADDFARLAVVRFGPVLYLDCLLWRWALQLGRIFPAAHFANRIQRQPPRGDCY